MARLKVTEDEYELLTEEERIGLKEHQAELEAELAAEDAEIAAAAAGDPEAEPKEPAVEEAEAEPEPEAEEEGAAEEEEPAVEESEEAGSEESADEDAEAGEESEDDSSAEADDEEEEQPATAAVGPLAALSDDDAKRMAAIDQELDAIAEKFDEGELTAKEMRTQQKTLLSELDALKDKRTVANVARQTAIDTWYGVTIPVFQATHPEYKDGTVRHKLLDTLVRELQIASTNPTDPKILATAHGQIVAEFGPAKGAAPPKKGNGKGNGKPKPQRETPPNFSAIPASDQTPVVSANKFARLDKLKGADYEKALAKLSPADREYYLQGG